VRISRIHLWLAVAMSSPRLFHAAQRQAAIAPVWINRMAWTKGYFQHLENLAVEHLFGRSCFHVHGRRFVDETGSVLEKRSEPYGIWALASYRRFDDVVSDALDIQGVSFSRTKVAKNSPRMTLNFLPASSTPRPTHAPRPIPCRRRRENRARTGTGSGIRCSCW
jgi:hypothetical protein